MRSWPPVWRLVCVERLATVEVGRSGRVGGDVGLLGLRIILHNGGFFAARDALEVAQVVVGRADEL